jgi:hypothetical protein
MGFVLGRLPEDDDELHAVVSNMWNVVIPRHTCGNPDHTPPFTAFADAYFNRGPSTSLWHGSRGLSGKSFMLSILGITKAFLLGADVNMLGGSLAQSQNLHEHMRNALNSDNSPRYMIETESQTLIKLSNKARIRPLTASQKTVRGPHPPFLILDEIDEMDIDILDAALGQPMPQKNYMGEILKPYTVMCSTWQNPEGTFTEVRRRFEDRGLPIIQWCYQCSANPIDGWLTQETIDAKKLEIPAEMWRTEYELGEPSIGNRAFNPEAVDNMFSLPMEPLTEKIQKDFEEYTFKEYERDGYYVASADWGKEQDYTVITVWRSDRDPFELVYYMRVNRRPYPQMIGWFNDAIKRYSADAIHDGTGLGNVVNDYVDIRARGFTMTGEKRAAMLTEYVNAVEKGRLKAPRIKTMYLEHKYAQVGDLYSNSQAFHLPDTVSSSSLAFRIMGRGGAPGGPVTVLRDNEPSEIEKMFSPTAQEYVVTRVSEEPNGFSLLV